MTCVFGFALVCAERTAIAMVSELTIRTTVFAPPHALFRCALASWNALGFGPAVHQVGHEQAAEEHDFGDEEHPHPEGRGLELLVHVIEVMLELRVMRVRRVALARVTLLHGRIVKRPRVVLRVRMTVRQCRPHAGRVLMRAVA